MAGIPLIIYGQVTEDGDASPSVTVKCRNETTNEIGTATANASGAYSFDLSDSNNFPSGWADGQQITIYTIYSNFEGEETLTIALPIYGYEQNIALTAITDSELIYYCTVQDIYDELDGKTSADISTERVVKVVQRAEGLIELKTETFFKEETVTDEVHTVDRNTIETSTDALDSYNNVSALRQDNFWSNVNNRVKTNYTPIVSITSLSYNSAGPSEADDWTAITEQTGSSGNYYLEDSNAGIIDFLTVYPRVGKRSWKITYVTGYDRDSTNRRVISILKCVERLTILLTSRMLITTKSSGSMFDSTKSTTIGNISISAGSMSAGQYLRSVDPEIKDLWSQLGVFGIEVI